MDLKSVGPFGKIGHVEAVILLIEYSNDIAPLPLRCLPAFAIPDEFVQDHVFRCRNGNRKRVVYPQSQAAAPVTDLQSSCSVAFESTAIPFRQLGTVVHFNKMDIDFLLVALWMTVADSLFTEANDGRCEGLYECEFIPFRHPAQ